MFTDSENPVCGLLKLVKKSVDKSLFQSIFKFEINHFHDIFLPHKHFVFSLSNILLNTFSNSNLMFVLPLGPYYLTDSENLGHGHLQFLKISEDQSILGS